MSLVYCQGNNRHSTPRRYHASEAFCWIWRVGKSSEQKVPKTFPLERDEAERLGWWACPYCCDQEHARHA